MDEKKEPLEVKVTNISSIDSGSGCIGIVILYFVARNLWLIAERLDDIIMLIK